MHKHTVRLFLYSSLAIVALTLVWGFKTIPRQAALAEDQLRISLEQEMILLSSAVRTATTALKFRLLDVLKAEGNGPTTRAFQDSPFTAALLLEWDGGQWKPLWQSTKSKEELSPEKIRALVGEWPLAKINGELTHFVKAGDVQGQPHFAAIVPVRRPSNTPMLGVGFFPASQFGLQFSADRAREVRVFDDQGFALALPRPAYLGTALKREPIVTEILEGDVLALRQEWKSERGTPMMGLAQRLTDSNLSAAIEVEIPRARTAALSAWLYLIFCALGAIGMNWGLFASLIRPLFRELEASEMQTEGLRRQLNEGLTLAPSVAPSAAGDLAVADPAIPAAELPDFHFVEPEPEPEVQPVSEESRPPTVSLAQVVGAALRTLQSRLKAHAIRVNTIGLGEVALEGDVLQLQTAIEEVLKNAIEAMQDQPQRELTLEAMVLKDEIRLRIEDTGHGIKPENLNKIFDPFYTTRDTEGVARGLGLNVARRVLEEMHGKIVVKNQVNSAGASVEMNWPKQKMVEVAVEAEEAVMVKEQADLDFLIDHSEDDFAAVKVTPPSFMRKPKVRALEA